MSSGVLTTSPAATASNSVVTAAVPGGERLSDVVLRLGDVPLSRIRVLPPVGCATEQDLLAREGEKPICELVDAVLVEKAMGFYESRLAAVLLHFIEEYLDREDLGVVLGADGLLRLRPGLVRAPDVAFISWRRLPNRKLPAAAIPDLAPDLAVEILSRSNTAGEMERKLGEYLQAGAGLVWYIDSETRSARVYTSLDSVQVLAESDTLDGGAVLPGFEVPLRKLFERAGRRGAE